MLAWNYKLTLCVLCFSISIHISFHISIQWYLHASIHIIHISSVNVVFQHYISDQSYFCKVCCYSAGLRSDFVVLFAFIFRFMSY